MPTLSSAVLRSAWVEPDATVRGAMWQPLLTFLRGIFIATYLPRRYGRKLIVLTTDFPDAWDIDSSSKRSKDEDAKEEDSEPDSDDAKPHNIKRVLRQVRLLRESLSSYQEFLRFLEQGCSGSPRDGYPMVVIALSTIPSKVNHITHSLVFAALTSLPRYLHRRILHHLSRTSSHHSGLPSTVVLSMHSTGPLLLLRSFRLYSNVCYSSSGGFESKTKSTRICY